MGFALRDLAAFSCFVIVHRTPSTVRRHPFNSSVEAGSSPNHFPQSSAAKKAGILSVGSVEMSELAGTVTNTQA